MNYSTYQIEIKNKLKEVLTNAGFVNGDTIGQKDKLSHKTYFFEFFNEKPDFQDQTYICWQLLDNQNDRHGDNIKIGGEQFFGVVVITPQKENAKTVKTICNTIEQAFENADWNVSEFHTSLDWETGKSTLSFTISKVFLKDDD